MTYNIHTVPRPIVNPNKDKVDETYDLYVDLTKDKLTFEEIKKVNKISRESGIEFNELAISFLEYKKLSKLFDEETGD